MRVIHILLLFLNLLYVGGLNIFISTPVKIIDCRAERDEGLLTVETTTQGPVDPEAFYEAARTGDIGYITAELARSEISSSRISSLLTWRHEDLNHRTPLHAAALEGHDTVALALLEAGASPNVKAVVDFTPMHAAARYGHTDVLRAMLQPKYHARVNQKNGFGQTPIELAAYNGHTDALEVLIDHGANINTVDEDNGWTPLMLAARNDHVGATRLLLQKGADKSLRDKNGHTAAYSGWTLDIPKEIKELIDNWQ